MEVYECMECKKMTEGFPATLRRKCLVCRNTELEMRYRKRKFESFTKKELADRHKQLIEKLRDEDDYSDGFSEVDDNPKDEDFIPTTPAPQRSSKRKLFNIQEKQNNKRQKKEEGNQDNSSDENSVQDSEQGSTQEHSEMESDNDEA